MLPKNIVLLNGSEAGDDSLAAVYAVLLETLRHSGARVTTFDLREMKIGPCAGCFGCWLKTPGACLQKDAGQEIAAAVMRSDLLVLFSPVVFGGYSPELKRVVDRCFSPLLQPYIGVYHGETHHIPRYARYPRLVGIGVQRIPDSGAAGVFRLVVGRNALNLHAPSYAAEVVGGGEYADTLRGHFEAVLTRKDAFPYRPVLPDLQAQVGALPAAGEDCAGRRALLLVGSPKGKRSTSACLGGALLDRLAARGWQTQTLTLKANLETEKGRAELLASAAWADLLALAFPLYNDGLPVAVIQALQALAEQRAAHATHWVAQPVRPRLAVIVNNGFPEAHHNIPAVAICRTFATQSGMAWAGSLAVGAGEALSGGQPLTERRGLPSVKHVLKALDRSAAALHAGQSIPAEAVKMIARTPIPLTPFFVWRSIFMKKAASRWEHEAAENNVSKEELLSLWVDEHD